MSPELQASFVNTGPCRAGHAARITVAYAEPVTAHTPRLALVSAAGALFSALLASVLLLFNLLVAASLIQTGVSGSEPYVAVPIAFITVALPAPVIVFRRSIRRQHSAAVAIRRAALTSIGVSLLMLPFSFGAVSM